LTDLNLEYIFPHVLYTLLLSDFNDACIFPSFLEKKTQISNLIKSVQWKGLVQCGQKDGHDKAKYRLRNFENVPENELILLL